MNQEKIYINKPADPKIDSKADTLWITIITVVYNCVKEIETTLKSVSSQTYPNIEYIVVDGQSTDGTKEIIKQYEAHIDHLISEKDEGIYDAMNKGIRNAHGNFINFLNAGDKFCSEKTIEEVVEQIDKQKSLDFAYGNILNRDAAHPDFKYQFGFAVNKRNLFLTVPICHQAMFINLNAFSEVGLYSKEYKIVSFYEWLIRYYVLKKDFSNVLYIKECVVEYLIGGASFKNKEINERERLIIAKKYFSKYYLTLNYLRFVREKIKINLLPYAYKLNLIATYRRIKQKVNKLL